MRLFVQACWTALTNGYVYGFTQGKIYTGQAKNICVPGLNCYSCPGAFGSCPIGSLQAVLDSPGFKMSCYVFGFLMLFGSLFGRFICGWLCPFGLVQDLVYKIPLFKKLKRKNLPGHKWLIYLKYIVLVLFVFVLPSVVTDSTGTGSPWFCEYICPSGMLFGGIPLTALNEGLRSAIGMRFIWKLFILIAVLGCDLIVYRPFCKYLCPLGAIYGLFNPFSLYRFEVDKNACIKCGKCQKACKMDIKVWEKPNSTECIRCGDCKHACPTGAIKNLSLKKKSLDRVMDEATPDVAVNSASTDSDKTE
ncbi:MAG: 4Fe-4S binding protein [Eubacteriales bacterium]|nr:4Fe-4S binding protein [Eubacteriales bacterium]